MLMRSSMRQQDWYREESARLANGIREAFQSDMPAGADPAGTAHHTRVYEYPWLLHHCPPRGRILDVGTEPQFGGGLLGLGHEVTFHHTPLDVPALGSAMTWAPHGGCRYTNMALKYQDTFSLVLGYLENCEFLRDDYFDTIYCASVIEHVRKDRLSDLLAGMDQLLRPGGCLGLTLDYWPTYPLDGGEEGILTNWDLLGFATQFVWVAGTPAEIHWHPEYDQAIWEDGDVLVTEWRNPLTVYGVVLRKP